ncbi:MAG: glycosyltransferase family 2 protein [Deltaproteobacteria bacterium]|nr:glycosyltransferase family 2 protein [Deltaproteobacteria bacterium]
MAEISVIIPTFNRPLKTARAVASVLYQTGGAFSIVVVDDGSTDHTLGTLAQFKGKIHVISHSKNRGVSAARNTGIRQCDSPLITFLDSDDYWLPRKLATQRRFMATHPEVMICQTDEIWIRNGRYANPMEKHRKPSGWIFEPSLKRCLVSPSAVMLRRALVEEVGLFDESLPACEDYDLWLRILCRYPIPLIRERLVVKEGGHPDQLSARYTGMDRFRIQSLMNLLESGQLTSAQREAVREEMGLKAGIYGAGCIKRGRVTEGAYFMSLLDYH